MKVIKSMFKDKDVHYILWGRSMGAVAALIHAHKYRNSQIDFLVLDSPFSSIETLVRDASGSYFKLGEYVAMMLYNPIVDIIKNKTGHDLRKLNPIFLCPGIETPALFAVAD